MGYSVWISDKFWCEYVIGATASGDQWLGVHSICQLHSDYVFRNCFIDSKVLILNVQLTQSTLSYIPWFRLSKLIDSKRLMKSLSQRPADHKESFKVSTFSATPGSEFEMVMEPSKEALPELAESHNAVFFWKFCFGFYMKTWISNWGLLVIYVCMLMSNESILGIVHNGWTLFWYWLQHW